MNDPYQRTTNRGVQTERPEDITKLYETGVLKYPSHTVAPRSKQTSYRGREQGDAPHNLAKSMQKLGKLNKRIS